MTLTGVSVKSTAAPGKEFKVGDVTLEGVEETEGGGYYAETVTLPDVDVKQDETAVTAKDITIGGLTIPGNPAGGTINDIVLYEIRRHRPGDRHRQGQAGVFDGRIGSQPDEAGKRRRL